MATFEEKILSYLDGSLPAEGREELLAGMSGAGAHAAERRALFDEHLRLADLMTLAQKPVSAPLVLQRDLASKVPVLAIKLPYLASNGNRRNSAIAGWFASARSSYLNSILFIALAIIGGCVWFAINHRNSAQSANGPSTSANHSNANEQGAGLSGGSSQSSQQKTSPPNTNGVGKSGNTPQSPVSRSRVEVSYPHHTVAPAYNNASNVRNASKNAIPGQSANNSFAINEIQAQDENSGSNQADMNSPEKNDPRAPETELQSAKILPAHPAEMIGSESTIHSLSTLNEREENNDPIHVFAAEEYRFTRVNPQSPLSEYTRSNGIQANSVSFAGEELGIDYSLNPWISIGLRGGYAKFVQEQAVTTSNGTTSGYNYLSRNVKETMLIDPNSLWLGPAITYSLSASEALMFAATLAAADAFTGSFSPILRGELAALLNMNDAIALRAAFSFEADRIPAATPIDQSNAAYTGLVVGSNPATHNSQVYGISLGIVIHP